jgi:hypothetical protein
MKYVNWKTITAFVVLCAALQVARRIGQEEMRAATQERMVYHVDSFRTIGELGAQSHCVVVVSNDHYVVWGESEKACFIKPGERAEVDSLVIQVGGKPKPEEATWALFNGQQSFTVTEARETKAK